MVFTGLNEEDAYVFLAVVGINREAHDAIGTLADGVLDDILVDSDVALFGLVQMRIASLTNGTHFETGGRKIKDT